MLNIFFNADVKCKINGARNLSQKEELFHQK